MTPYIIAKQVVQKIVHHGYKAYFAGGYVRDRLLNHPSDDIDIATNAPTEEIMKIFPRTIPVGVNYGIVIVVHEGHHFEVASFRKEAGYKDGRRPDHIESATAEEDAQRRDFTINGMFFDPLSEQVFDYVGGKEDLHKKVIRAIGDPHERFLEDRLRMIRAVRYAARFHFTIDPDTIAAIIAHAQDLFPAVAIERIVQEFKKMALFSNFPLALVTLHKYQLLGQIFPQIQTLTEDEVTHRLKHLPHFPSDAPLIAKLLELFGPLPLSEKIELCEKLKLSKEDKRFVEQLDQWENFPPGLDDYDLVGIYAGPNAGICLSIAALHMEDSHFRTFHEEKMALLQRAIVRRKEGKTIVTSAHLMERGIEPGIRMGKLLIDAERIAVNHHLDTPDAILSRL